MALSPGDRIAYHFELMDNDAVSGPKLTRSPEYSLRFPTIEQMYAQQEEEHQQGIEDLRTSLEKQIELRQELDKITRDTHQESGLQWEQKQEVQELLDRQKEILNRMESLSAGLDVAYQQKMWQVLIDYGDVLTKAWFARGRFTYARHAYPMVCEAARRLEEQDPYIAATKKDPVAQIATAVQDVFGGHDSILEVSWPLYIRAARQQ